MRERIIYATVEYEYGHLAYELGVAQTQYGATGVLYNTIPCHIVELYIYKTH